MKDKLQKAIDLVKRPTPKGDQSVRTTFNLNKECLDNFNWLLKVFNAKPKKIFDIMNPNFGSLYDAIPSSNKNKTGKQSKRKRKTFVISKNGLNNLNGEAKRRNIPRDLFVEKIIMVFKKVIEISDFEEEKKEKEAQSIISEFIGKAEEVEKKLTKILDEDSPILGRFGQGIIIFENLDIEIDEKLKNGTPIDPYSL